MDKYQQFLEWLRQQEGNTFGNTNMGFNTPDNTQMQGYTQNVWNGQTTPTTTTNTPSINFNPNFQVDQNPSLNVDLGAYTPQSYTPNMAVQQNQMTEYTTPPTGSITTNQNSQNFLNSFPTSPVDNSVFKLGQSLAFNSNNPYASDKARGWNTVKGIAAGGKTLASLLRTGLSGAAYQNRENDVRTEFYNRQNQQSFAPLSFEDGGQFRNTTAFNPNLATNTNFQQWYSQNTVEGQNNVPYSDNLDYDYLSYYMNGANIGAKSGHFPDTFKRTNHQTFSNESIYSTPDNPGGSWVGEVFTPNNQYKFKDGGQVSQEQFLTGSYIGNQPMPNAEIEKNEFVQTNDGVVQQAIGETHEKGGIPVQLEAGSRIISDNLKLGGQNARELKKEFDIDIKANNTFAEAVSKYKNKIGLTKLDKQQEDIFKQLETKTDIKDEQTKAINESYLGKQIQESELAKTPLKEKLSSFTDLLFQKQEQLKGNTTELQFENGGVYTGNQLKDLYKKHNLTEEQGVEIINSLKTFADGGEYPVFTPSRYAKSSYGNQPFLVGSTRAAGDIGNADALTERLRYQNETLPYVIGGTGIYNPTDSTLNLANTSQFQQNYDNYVNATAAEIDANPYLTAAEKNAAKQQVVSQRLGISNKNGQYDNIYGEETSSRTNFVLPYLKQEDRQKYANVRFLGDVIDSNGEIKAEYKDLDPDTKNLLKSTYSRQGKNALNIGLGDIRTANNTPQETVTTMAAQENYNTPAQQATPFGGLNLIDQTLPPPNGVQASRMGEAQYRNYEAVQQSYEPQLQQLYSQESAAIDQIAGLSPAARAAAITGISANTQVAANQVVGQVNNANQVEQARIGNMNTDLFNRQQLQDNLFRDQYEQKTFQALSTTNADLQNWYQYNNQLSAVNAQQQNQAATLSNLFDNYTLDANGRVVRNGINAQYYNPVTGLPTTQVSEKPKTTKKK